MRFKRFRPNSKNHVGSQCTIVMIATMLGKTFDEAYAIAGRYAKKRRNNRLSLAEEKQVLKDYGFVRLWGKGAGKRNQPKISTSEAAKMLNKGDMGVAWSAGHVFSMTNTTVIDTFDSRRRKVKELWVRRADSEIPTEKDLTPAPKPATMDAPTERGDNALFRVHIKANPWDKVTKCGRTVGDGKKVKVVGRFEFGMLNRRVKCHRCAA